MMLLHMLSSEDQEIFMVVATLLSLSDNDILVNGKSLDDIMIRISDKKEDLKFSFVESEQEIYLLQKMRSECLKHDLSEVVSTSSIPEISEIINDIVDIYKDVPLESFYDPEKRLEISIRMMKVFLEEDLVRISSIPSVPKLMLFELMLIALADETITHIEIGILKEFSNLTQVEDFIFDDLMERAKATNLEASRTLSLILE